MLPTDGSLSNQAASSIVQPQPVSNNDTSNEQQIQQVMATQLMSRTGMTLEYSVLCLKETGWNLEQAFIAFTTNKVYFSILYRCETSTDLSSRTNFHLLLSLLSNEHSMGCDI